MNLESYGTALQRLLRVPSSPRLGLERMETLLAELGNPHKSLKVFHIAGTNGKGSTAAFVTGFLQVKGFRVGLTTSPHLRTARERIQIDGTLVSVSRFIELEEKVARAAELMSDPPTFFERMVAMAFTYFKEENVDYAVVEVGLGGRLDATNVVTPQMALITPVSLDHEQFLGTTLAEIAKEKAGIIKPGRRVVIGKQEPEALTVIEAYGKAQKATLSFLGSDFVMDTTVTEAFCMRDDDQSVTIKKMKMPGEYQKENCTLAWAGVKAAGIHLSHDDINKVVATTLWPGRLEILESSPFYVIDGAHNIAGVARLSHALSQELSFPVHDWVLIVGFSQGHDPQPWAAAWPQECQPQEVWVVPPNMPRALPLETTLERIRHVWPQAKGKPDLNVAIDEALRRVSPGGGLCLAGSLYLVGEARALWRNESLDPQFPLF